jgi:hypothetical protein
MKSHWQAWFAFAVLRLGLRPADFWALSLSEWLALVRASQGGTVKALSRQDLEALLQYDISNQDTDNE